LWRFWKGRKTALFYAFSERENHMARPYKQGLQYFPLDVNYFDDDKIQELNNQYGYLGEIIFIRLLTMVYANGYYLEKTIPSIARQIIKCYDSQTPSQAIVEAVIRYCGEIGLLDHGLLLSGVVTSEAIQKQFILSTKRRKQIDMEKYGLLSTKTLQYLKKVNDDNNRVNDDNNPLKTAQNGVNVDNERVNVDRSTQSKGKERKIDKNIDKRAASAPSFHYLTNCLLEAKYESVFSLNLPLYDELFGDLIRSYGFEQVWTVTRYIIKASKQNGTLIDNRYEYFKVSALNNLETFRKRKGTSDESFEDWVKRTLLSVAG
jgi:hypothetical protein